MTIISPYVILPEIGVIKYMHYREKMFNAQLQASHKK